MSAHIPNTPVTLPLPEAGPAGRDSALMYGCSSERLDTLLPGYVSRPHPSPQSRLVSAELCTADTAQRACRALTFPEVLSSEPPVERASAVPRQRSPPRFGSNEGFTGRDAGLLGYGELEAAMAPSAPAPVPSCRTALADDTNNGVVASLQAELHAGALQSESLQSVPEPVAARKQSQQPAATPEAARDGGARLELGQRVTKQTEVALSQLRLPTCVLPYVRLYCALSALHALLARHHVQVRSRAPTEYTTCT